MNCKTIISVFLFLILIQSSGYTFGFIVTPEAARNLYYNGLTGTNNLTNVLDGNNQTGCFISTAWTGKIGFTLGFSNPITVDQIKLNCAGDIQVLNIKGYLSTETDKTLVLDRDYTFSGQSDLIIKNQFGITNINALNVTADTWEFDVIKAVNTDGSCRINEVGFYSAGQKYNNYYLTNYIDAYANAVLDYRTERLKLLWLGPRKVIYRESCPLSAWIAYGVINWQNISNRLGNYIYTKLEINTNTNFIWTATYFVPYYGNTNIYINSVLCGEIKAADTASVYSVQLGYWGMDEDGRVWIRIGTHGVNTPWKRGEQGIEFFGTDLGDIVQVEEVR